MIDQIYPVPIIIMDYLLGIIMWTLLGRGVLDLFIPQTSEMVIVKVFRQVTAPIIRLFKKITPAFLAFPMVPFYVAWWFYMVRFYVIPLIFFGEWGTLSFPLESDFVKMFLGINK